RNLNQVGLTDFRKKCFYLDVGHINDYLKEARAQEEQKGAPPQKRVTFMDVVQLLHRTFGGNYRALEFFNRLVKENPGKIKQSLVSMETFETGTAKEMEEAKQQMGQNLLFSQLMALLEPERQNLLRLISRFRVRVQMTALEMQEQEQIQTGTSNLSEMLMRLHQLTLIEVSRDPKFQVVFFYVTPIVKDLLEEFEKDNKEKPLPFSHQKAGEYYYHRYYNMEGGLTSLEEAFYHFDSADNMEKINEIGDRLTSIYEGYSLFQNAFFYANRVYERLGDETKPSILNRLAFVFKLSGDNDRSLALLKIIQAAYKKSGDKSGEGTTLSNISQIYYAKGDY
ncbi:MAG: hypothetical protein GY940_39720, partial [bacterium]|nr:hypothetical protein [bacterium]